jgi:hypothetical protein
MRRQMRLGLLVAVVLGGGQVIVAATLAVALVALWRNRPPTVRGYLAQPIVLTRGAVLGTLAAITVLASSGILIGIAAVRGLADERSARSLAARRDLARRLATEAAARRRGDLLGRRLARLESPSQRTLERDVERVLEVLRSNPRLRAAFRQTLDRTRPTLRPTPPPPAARRPGSSTRPPAPGPSTPSSPPPASGSPPSPPVPPARPPADVQTPSSIPTPLGELPLPRPSVCIHPLGGLNCPPQG